MYILHLALKSVTSCELFVLLGEFATYLRHVRNLKFTDKPDYSYLRNLFYDVLRKHSWECDWEFDWVVQQKVYTEHLVIINV